jgi:hypothetical protein
VSSSLAAAVVDTQRLDKGANRVSHDRMIDALNKFTSNRNIELPDTGRPSLVCRCTLGLYHLCRVD